MSASLLENLLDLGETVRTALERGDLDAYFELMDERGTLIDIILKHEHPSELDPNWEETAHRLSIQNDALMEAAELQRRRMQDAITRIEQVKEAQRSYSQPPGRPQILNQDLRV